MNQIPNIEEEIRHFCNAFAMTMPPSNEMMQATRNLRAQLPGFIHHQLQKAREDERERIKQFIQKRRVEVNIFSAETGDMFVADVVKAIDQSELDQDKK